MRNTKGNTIGNVPQWLAIPVLLVLSGLLTLAKAETYGFYTYSTDGVSVTISKYSGSEASVTIPDFIRGTPVTTIGGAFRDCTSLTNVIVGNCVTSIGGATFDGCTGLKSITIPDNVTSIGGSAFSGCTGLKSITIPDNVTSIGIQSFYNCTSLTNVIIGQSVTNVGNGAFYGCTGLRSITIPNSVTSIEDYAFYQCKSLTNVTVPDKITSIGGAVFYGCSGLMSITIPDNVTSIGDGAFSGCTGLKSITIPVKVTSIGGGAFAGCSGLISVTIPDNVTSIGDGAFRYCNRLNSVIIGNSSASMGYYAFAGCPCLRSVYFVGNAPTSVAYGLFDGDASIIMHYLAETTGWGATFAGYSTALWVQKPPYQEWTKSVGLLDKFPDASGDMDDPDDDGLNNLQEWQAGTDPTNPNSALRFESKPRIADLADSDKTPLNPGEHALYLQTIPYRQYDIQSVTSLGGVWQTEVTVTATTTQKRILVYKGLDKALYRAILVP